MVLKAEELTRTGRMLQDFLDEMALMGGKLGKAAFVFAVGFVLMKLGRKGFKRLLSLRIYGKNLAESRRDTINALMLNVYDCVGWFVLVSVALGALGVDVSSILAVAGVGGIAIGFGAQTLVKDVLAGMLIFFEEQYAVGDIVDLGGLSGEVAKMTLRTTELRSFEGNLHVIPNGEIRTVTNQTRSFHRAVVDITVDYQEPLDRVMRVLDEVLAGSYPEVEGLSAPPNCIGVTNLNSVGVVLRILADCQVKQHWAVERALRLRIKNRFDQEGIRLALPQRLVRLESQK